MSRIRSIHPSLFTDEAFMAASPHARIFLIGLWTEADDQGVFEWKPLTLKARILPVDSVDACGLLAEIEAGAFILRFEHDGKPYGAIKNFRKYQRPQKPNEVHPLPENLRIYVGLSASVIVGVTDQSRTSTIKPPQMEDVGCRMEEDTDAIASVTRDDWPTDWFDLFWEKYPNKVGKPKAQAALATHRKRKTAFSEIMAGLDRYIRDKPPDRPWCNPLTWVNQERWGDQPAQVIPLNRQIGAQNGVREATDILRDAAAQLRAESAYGACDGTYGHDARLLPGPR